MYKHVKIYQHVDDMSCTIVHDNNDGLHQQTVRFAKNFAQGIDDLKMVISETRVIIPRNNVTKGIAKTLNRLDVPLKCDKSGIDIEVIP